MSVSRLKNMILLVLTICALSLLAIAIPNRLSQPHEQRRMLAELKTLYDSYGLSVALDELPASATLYSVELSDTGIQTAAQALLGAKAAPAGDADRFETSYASELGTLTAARSGAFSAALTGSAQVKNYEKSAEKLLRSMGYQVQQLQQEKPADGTVVLTASQSLLGVPIFGGSLTLTYLNAHLASIEGTFYTGSEAITRVSEQESISGADALARLLAAPLSHLFVGYDADLCALTTHAFTLFSWSFLLVAIGIYLIVKDAEGFRRYMWTIMITFTTATVFCALVPNGQDLRPAVMEHQNIAAWLLQNTYNLDTNTNVLPSVHVLGVVAGVAAAWHTPGLRKWGWRAGSMVLGAVIIASTLLVKQHAFIDMVAGLLVGAIGYVIVYVIIGKKRDRLLAEGKRLRCGHYQNAHS